jgi:hypothetical protein
MRCPLCCVLIRLTDEIAAQKQSCYRTYTSTAIHKPCLSYVQYPGGFAINCKECRILAFYYSYFSLRIGFKNALSNVESTGKVALTVQTYELIQSTRGYGITVHTDSTDNLFADVYFSAGMRRRVALRTLCCPKTRTAVLAERSLQP